MNLGFYLGLFLSVGLIAWVDVCGLDTLQFFSVLIEVWVHARNAFPTPVCSSVELNYLSSNHSRISGSFPLLFILFFLQSTGLPVGETTMLMLAGSIKNWIAVRGREGFSSVLPRSASPYIPTTRKRIDRVRVCRPIIMSVSAKQANLSAGKKERIKLPNRDDGYRIGEFLRHPDGIEVVLNTGSLQSFESIDTNTYRCFLPKVKLLNFEANPVLDLRVTPTENDCTVELLSCKFQGSEAVERQNEKFSAFMMNHMNWGTDDSEAFLEIDVKLNLTLEIYTKPFTLLPASAVEGPGNLVMQALVDRLVPLLLEQLMKDYISWESKICQSIT